MPFQYIAIACLCFVTLEFRLHSDSVRAQWYRKKTKKAAIYFCWYVCHHQCNLLLLVISSSPV
jgi:hypothetical protein